MRRTARGAVLALGVTAVFLVGCSSGTPGQARSSSTSGATEATSVTSDGGASGDGSPSQAPKVAHPLDASKTVTNPCSSLTQADAIGLNITSPIAKANTAATGSHCGWTGTSGGSIGIGWVTTNTDGLSDLYVKSNTIAYWQPTTVAGYPAAFGDSISDGRAQGDCVINVGVNDHLAFFAQYDNPSNASQSCALAQQAASDVIKNLKSTGGS